MKTINEYQDKVAEILLRDYFPLENNWLIGTTTVTKNNDTKLSAITIRKCDEAVASTHYIDGFFIENYTEEAAAHRIYETYNKEVSTQQTLLNIEVKDFSDLNKMKDCICYKVINTEMNRSFLNEVPHISITPDLSLQFYLNISNGTVTITDKIASVWGIPKDKVAQQLYEIAEANIARTKPAVCCPMVEVLKEMLPPDVYEDVKESNSVPLYVLTNKSKIFGAATIAYERGQLLNKCREQIERSIGIPLSGIYILPSSIHEILLVPATPDIDVQYLHSLVKEVNRTQVSQEEKLSDEIFYFDKNEGLAQLTFNVREISR